MEFKEEETDAAKRLSAKDKPRWSSLVRNALHTLRKRDGSSYRAIFKYIELHYGQMDKETTNGLKEYIKSAVCNGALIQYSGNGLRGRFKLPTTGKTRKAQASVPGKMQSTGGAKGKLSIKRKKTTAAAAKTKAKKPNKEATKKASPKKKTEKKA